LKVWLDVHLSPAIAAWLSEKFGVEAICVSDLRMSTMEDEDILLRRATRERLRDDE
jgi:predicted nuclease of predicted toxin-antitoxin system